MYSWTYIISKSAYGKQVPVLFHLFLSGDEGCGKSDLIKIVYHSVSKLFLYQNGSSNCFNWRNINGVVSNSQMFK